MILPLKKNAHLEEARSCSNNKNVTEGKNKKVWSNYKQSPTP